jgi:hypothetical protein
MGDTINWGIFKRHFWGELLRHQQTIRTASMRGFGGSIPNTRGGSPLSTQRQNFRSAVTMRC